MLKCAKRFWNEPGKRVVSGQATWLTHPELLAEGEISPGMTAAEFATRRRRLAECLPADAVALVAAPPVTYMSGAVPYPYRPDANFLYLTGVRTSGSLAAISSAEGSGQGAFTLFVPDPSQLTAQWEGPQLHTAAAQEIFGAHSAFPMSQLSSRLPGFLAGAQQVLCDLPAISRSRHLSAALSASKVADKAISPLAPLMHRLRWVKSPAEVDAMRRSSRVAASGIKKCMQRTQPGVFEFQLAADFDHHCKMEGADRMAYPPIVASGADACTIHYSRNDKALASGDMIKMDAGCELHGYNSDITRCWPVNGSFSPQQRAIYKAVLEINRKVISHVQPGVRVSELHSWSCAAISEALVNLGILGWTQKAPDAHRPFYPHSLAHWLGLDVHDCGNIKMDALELQPGVVLTVEPGLYIPDQERFGSFAGIGVRIEDDIVCTKSGAEVMSAGVPTDPDEVEALVGYLEHSDRQAASACS